MKALKWTWDFAVRTGSIFLSSSYGHLTIVIFLLIIGGQFASWIVASAVYPLLPSSIAGWIETQQKFDRARVHDFWNSSPTMFLALRIWCVGAVVYVAAVFGSEFFGHFFKPKELLDKVASTENDLKATQKELRDLQEELRQMKNTQGNTPP